MWEGKMGWLVYSLFYVFVATSLRRVRLLTCAFRVQPGYRSFCSPLFGLEPKRAQQEQEWGKETHHGHKRENKA